MNRELNNEFFAEMFFMGVEGEYSADMFSFLTFGEL